MDAIPRPSSRCCESVSEVHLTALGLIDVEPEGMQGLISHISIYVHAYTNTYRHTYIHTYIHTYLHVDIHPV